MYTYIIIYDVVGWGLKKIGMEKMAAGICYICYMSYGRRSIYGRDTERSYKGKGLVIVSVASLCFALRLI